MSKLNCVICGRNYRTYISKSYCQPLCSHHEYQYVKYGEFFKWNIRNENEYITDGNTSRIILRDIKMNKVGEVIIDTKNLQDILKYKWNMTPQGYARSGTFGISLHELILGKKDGFVIDHENRNRLDCREENLRHVSNQLNGINKGKQSNNTSGHVGVSWDKKKNKWEAHIKLNGKKKFLGYYEDIEDAVEARLKGEIEYFGFNVDRINDCNTVFKNKKKK